jgi:threonine synthase
MITLATAHPRSFPMRWRPRPASAPLLPKRMADLYERPERVTEVANDLAALEALIREKRSR